MMSELNMSCQTVSDLTVMFLYVTYAFQSESTLYICLNVKELLVWLNG